MVKFLVDNTNNSSEEVVYFGVDDVGLDGELDGFPRLYAKYLGRKYTVAVVAGGGLRVYSDATIDKVPGLEIGKSTPIKVYSGHSSKPV